MTLLKGAPAQELNAGVLALLGHRLELLEAWHRPGGRWGTSLAFPYLFLAPGLRLQVIEAQAYPF
jgi:hypothetical protein